MVFIDAERGAQGVEPICRVLQVVPSWDYALDVDAKEVVHRG